MNDALLSIGVVALLLASSTTGALAAERVAVNSGDSMEPTLCEWSVVLVDRDATPRVGDIVVAENAGERIVHRVVGTSPDWDYRDGEMVEDTGTDWVLSGDNNVDSPDGEGDGFDEKGRFVADYTDHEQVLGVVSTVVYDGCGPV